MTFRNRFHALGRGAALVGALALIPATTAGLAQVDGRAGPQFARLMAVYDRIKATHGSLRAALEEDASA